MALSDSSVVVIVAVVLWWSTAQRSLAGLTATFRPLQIDWLRTGVAKSPGLPSRQMEFVSSSKKTPVLFWIYGFDHSTCHSIKTKLIRGHSSAADFVLCVGDTASAITANNKSYGVDVDSNTNNCVVLLYGHNTHSHFIALRESLRAIRAKRAIKQNNLSKSAAEHILLWVYLFSLLMIA